MAIVMKDTATIARKFAQRAQAAAGEYKSGVDATTDWAGPTQAAAPNYDQGVTAAIGRQAFQKGVAAAGTAKWKDKASNVGSTRYPQGVAGAEQAYAAGFDKFANVLKGVPLGPRGPKGAPQNLQRVADVANALHRAKTGQ
jgi:hypothetical protein